MDPIFNTGLYHDDGICINNLSLEESLVVNVSD